MPFAPVYNADSRILILGSHPSVESKRQGFYYMNPRNRFWPIMQCILGEKLVDVPCQLRAERLLAHGVALYDVVGQCRIEGSSDASIRGVVPNDIQSIMHAAPIRRIFLNGQTAYRLFCRFMPQWVSISNVLPSTSPANARFGLDALAEQWQAVAEALQP